MAEELRCRHCGAANEPDARFCGECGGELAAPAGGTTFVPTPSATPGGTTFVPTPSATPGGTVFVQPVAGGTTLVQPIPGAEAAPAAPPAPGLIAGLQARFGRPVLMLAGAATALVVVLIAGGIWLGTRKDKGTSSVYLSNSPTSQVGTTSTSGPAPAAGTPAPAAPAPGAQPAPATQPPSSGGAPAAPNTPAATPSSPAPSTPAPAPAPSGSPSSQPAANANWKVLAQGNLGVNWAGIWPFERNGLLDVFMVTTGGGTTTAHFASWNGSKEEVTHTASHPGQAIGLTTGDMFNMGADLAIVNFGATLWGFDNSLDDDEVTNADGTWSNIVIGDFTGSGKQETLVQVPGVGYGLYRFSAGQPQQVVGVLKTADKGPLRLGVVDSAGRRLLAVYSGSDQKITNWRWTNTGFVAGPSLPLSTAPVLDQCFWNFKNAGQQYTVVGFPGGSLKLYRFDGSNFALSDTITVQGGGSWCPAGGNFTDTGFEIAAFDTNSRGRYVIFGHK
ncbi:MAG TPA: zinc ribbon domain-containing protein [Symbiobacteriaceae bacterium]